MSKLETFLSEEDEQAIINAIKQAELKTSGEIRVHIESAAKGDAFKRAKVVFRELRMDKTRDRNGILIYIALTNKTFVILGDKGINNAVGNQFWESTKTIIANHFKQGEFKQGIVEGILKAGDKLKHFFPRASDDTNELPNTISKT